MGNSLCAHVLEMPRVFAGEEEAPLKDAETSRPVDTTNTDPVGPWALRGVWDPES